MAEKSLWSCTGRTCRRSSLRVVRECSPQRIIKPQNLRGAGDTCWPLDADATGSWGGCPLRESSPLPCVAWTRALPGHLYKIKVSPPGLIDDQTCRILGICIHEAGNSSQAGALPCTAWGPWLCHCCLSWKLKRVCCSQILEEGASFWNSAQEGKQWRKSILFWSLERDLPRNQEENSFLPKSPSSTLYRQALMSCWVAKEKYLQGPILLSQSMQKGWICSWPVILQ